MRKEAERNNYQKNNSQNTSFYKEQIELLEKKNDLLHEKLKTVEGDFRNSSSKEFISSHEGNNQGLKSRFEETNAALERAFERISVLESENNKLMEAINNEKSDRNKIQKQLDKKNIEYRNIQDERKTIELEKINIRESFRLNNEQIDQIKKEKSDLERNLNQLIEEKKIYSMF